MRILRSSLFMPARPSPGRQYSRKGIAAGSSACIVVLFQTLSSTKFFFAWVRDYLSRVDGPLTDEQAVEVYAVCVLARARSGWIIESGNTRIVEVNLLAELILAGHDPVDLTQRIRMAQSHVTVKASLLEQARAEVAAGLAKLMPLLEGDLAYIRRSKAKAEPKRTAAYDWIAVEPADGGHQDDLRSQGWVGYSIGPRFIAVRPVGVTRPLDGWEWRTNASLLAELGVALPDGVSAESR